MDVLLKILINYGPLGLILIVVVYILIRGQLTFKYPRSNGK